MKIILYLFMNGTFVIKIIACSSNRIDIIFRQVVIRLTTLTGVNYIRAWLNRFGLRCIELIVLIVYLLSSKIHAYLIYILSILYIA